MNDAAPRIAVGALLLAAVWVLTYWLWTPGSPATVAAGAGGDAGPRDAAAPITFDAASALPRPAVPPTEGPPPPASDALAQGAAPNGVIAPEFVEYTVRAGDDVWAIAGRVYGDRSLWQSISKANPFVDINRLRTGQVIRIPVDPRNIQGLPASAPGTAAAGEPDAPPEPPAPMQMEYIVARGDTLSGIAKSIYGRASLWTLIRDANAGQVNADGTNIRPGMKLIIPPAPAR